jgi:hypothetical protein
MKEYGCCPKFKRRYDTVFFGLKRFSNWRYDWRIVATKQQASKLLVCQHLSPPEYWKNLGSSKTRTKEEEIKGRDLILQKITETTENTAIAFTDGSCLNNPGPCGAGAIVFVEEETTELKQLVCKRGSILLGELIAIKIVLEYIDQPEIRRKIEQLTIFSDSQTVLNGLLDFYETLHICSTLPADMHKGIWLLSKI